MNSLTVEVLVEQIQQGQTFDYLLFWGHRPPKSGVNKSCLSQWFESSFRIDGTGYATAEHYMMSAKARLFDDHESAEAAVAAVTPAEAKKVGRNVENFDEATWLEHRYQIVVEANRAKFTQNELLRTYLVSTGDRVLVEASPVDPVWGIGLAADHINAQSPERWRGLNLLGFALMEVRNELTAD